MSSILKIHEEELGRFLVAYYRGVLPRGWKFGAAFCLFYNINDDPEIKNEQDDERAFEMIRDKYTGRLG